LGVEEPKPAPNQKIPPPHPGGSKTLWRTMAQPPPPPTHQPQPTHNPPKKNPPTKKKKKNGVPNRSPQMAPPLGRTTPTKNRKKKQPKKKTGHTTMGCKIHNLLKQRFGVVGKKKGEKSKKTVGGGVHDGGGEKRGKPIWWGLGKTPHPPSRGGGQTPTPGPHLWCP